MPTIQLSPIEFLRFLRDSGANRFIELVLSSCPKQQFLLIVNVVSKMKRLSFLYGLSKTFTCDALEAIDQKCAKSTVSRKFSSDQRESNEIRETVFIA